MFFVHVLVDIEDWNCGDPFLVHCGFNVTNWLVFNNVDKIW